MLQLYAPRQDAATSAATASTYSLSPPTTPLAIAVALNAPTNFALLGLPEGLPAAAVRKRYLMLARLLHPDKVPRGTGAGAVGGAGGGAGAGLAVHAEEAFKRVKDAYGAIRAEEEGER